MPKTYTPGLVFQPVTYRGMQRGIRQIVSAIRPTLGPLARIVAVDEIHRHDKVPEVLDSGGVIARRVIELGERDADMGAMLIRSMVCRLHEQIGDGTATAAVLFEALYNGGVHYITSGGNAMRLRHYLNEALQLVLAELDRMTVRVEGKDKLARLAESVCYDPPLAKLLGEIFSIIGEYGQLEIRTGKRKELEREYLDGMYWQSGLLSREMLTDRVKLRMEIEEPAIIISDLEIEHAYELLPLIEMAIEQAQVHTLLFIVRSLSEEAIATLLLANKNPEKFQVYAVKAPGTNPTDEFTGLEDLAVLTGATPLLKAAGQTLKGVTPDHLGWARRAWATPKEFGIGGAQGDPRAIRKHIKQLQVRFKAADDLHTRKALQQRIGRLMGGTATLWIGGATETETTARKELAQRAADALRGAVLEGVLPGGGTALLACQSVLRERLSACEDADERAAYRILMKALAEPLRTIAANAGHDPSEIMAQIKLAGPGCGFDVITGQLVDMNEGGILDGASVQKMALQSAVSTAGLALTIDVLVHHKSPEIVQNP